MDFTITEEQTMLQDALRRFLAAKYTFAARREIIRSSAGVSRPIWKSFADELGVLGALSPVENGGIGGDGVELMLIMDALGEAMVVEPFLETIVIAAHILAKCPSTQSNALLTQIIEGDAIVAPVGLAEALDVTAPSGIRARKDGKDWILNGSVSVVMAAPIADSLIVAARADTPSPALFIVAPNAPGLSLHGMRTIDARRAGDIFFNDVRVSSDFFLEPTGDPRALLENCIARGIAGICAEAVGGMRRLVADTVAYTKQRRQFGKAISEFQVLQHRMVDMHIAVQLAESATYLAILNLDSAPALRDRALSAAKATIAEKARFVGQAAVQLHGGMGMTDDIAVSHIFKRLTVIENEFGSRDQHIARYRSLMQVPA